MKVNLKIALASFGFGKLVQQFIDENPEAQGSLANANTAEQHCADLPKRLYSFLYENEVEAELMLARGLKIVPRDGSTVLMARLNAGKTDKTQVQHLVVKVNSLVVDLCFKRLGTLLPVYNYPLRELQGVFSEIKPALQLLNKKITSLYSESAEYPSQFQYNDASAVRIATKTGMVTISKGTVWNYGNQRMTSIIVGDRKLIPTPAQMKRISERSKAWQPKVVSPKTLEDYKVADYTWYKYVADTKSNIKDKNGAIVATFSKGMIFGVKESKRNDKVLVAGDARKVFSIDATITDRLIARSSSYRGTVKLVNAPVASAPLTVKPPVVKKRPTRVDQLTPIRVPEKAPAPLGRTLTVDLDDLDDIDEKHASAPRHMPELEADDGSDLVEHYRSFLHESSATPRVKL